MSTPETGDAGFAKDVVDQAKQLIAQGAREEQLELGVSPTPEDIAEAREALGSGAGNLSVLRKAREIRRGRPAGAKNKRTDDFARWILSFGPHPARTLMEVASAAPEVLIENSKRKVSRMTKSGNLVEYYETMSYDTAMSLRLRAAEALMPYLESKKPVAVDLSFNGVADLVIQGVTHSESEMQDLIDADFMDVDAELPAPEDDE